MGVENAFLVSRSVAWRPVLSDEALRSDYSSLADSNSCFVLAGRDKDSFFYSGWLVGR